MILKTKKKCVRNKNKDYQPPVDSDPEDVSEIAPPPKPDGADDDGGEGAEDAAGN